MFRLHQSLGLNALKSGAIARALIGADQAPAFANADACPSGNAPSAFLRRRRRRRAKTLAVACPTEPGRSWR